MGTYEEFMDRMMSEISRNFVFDDILMPEWIWQRSQKAGGVQRRVFVDAVESSADPPDKAREANKDCPRCRASFHLKGDQWQVRHWSKNLTATRVKRNKGLAVAPGARRL